MFLENVLEDYNKTKRHTQVLKSLLYAENLQVPFTQRHGHICYRSYTDSLDVILHVVYYPEQWASGVSWTCMIATGAGRTHVLSED